MVTSVSVHDWLRETPGNVVGPGFLTTTLVSIVWDSPVPQNWALWENHSMGLWTSSFPPPQSPPYRVFLELGSCIARSNTDYYFFLLLQVYLLCKHFVSYKMRKIYLWGFPVPRLHLWYNCEAVLSLLT